MPTKNFFLSLLLAPTRSSRYPFLYITCKKPMAAYSSSTMLNCQQPQNPTTSMLLNYNLAQTLHDMPSGHVGHLCHRP
jgi:hypothetical protein